VPIGVMIERCSSVTHRGWIDLRRELWPQCSESRHLAEMSATCSAPERFCAFIAYDDAAAHPVGFVEAAARTDHVNGTNTSPVGYLEGIYVVPSARRHGLARQLYQQVEAWARDQGFREMASDARIENEASYAMHRAVGFAEVMRAVQFRKDVAGNEQS